MGKHNDSPCDFRALLEQREYEKFEKRALPTNAWLQVTDKVCPQCKKKVFLRIRDGQKWLLCENWFHKNGTCRYKQKL